MARSASRRLQVRMIAAFVTLVGLTAVLVVGLWAVLVIPFLALGVIAPVVWGTGATALVLTMLVMVAVWRRDHGRDRERTPVDPGDRVHRLATRIAHQFDVPVPDLFVVERPAPTAMTIGRRPDRAELAISRGTLDALNDDELEAVIAHELAHVANRDAWVMTMLAIPIVIADGLSDRIRIRNSRDLVAGALKLFALSIEWAGRIVVAICGRERERAADRAAARVTGSPAALASALASLDASIAETPGQDLRSVAGESTLSIVALDDPTEPLLLGPEGERTPTLWPIRKRFRAWTRSHPPTDERIERLRSMAAEQS